jgi:hypothetical protein
MIKFNEFLDNYVDNFFLHKITDIEYFVKNGFICLTRYFINDKDQQIRLHLLWQKKYYYLVRISDYNSNHIYYFEWHVKDLEYFYDVARVVIVDDIIDGIKMLLEKASQSGRTYKSYFDSKYNLV